MSDEANARFECCSDVEHVLKVGREFQMEDRMRGAHYDTAKLLCDTIEYLYERVPKPDPDWKEICEKCKDGEIESDCEYYGEPNGCNSPIYGEHPKEQQKIGNAAAMREAVLWVIDRMNAALIDGKMECEETIDKCKSALSEPPRNCDRFRTADEADKAFNEFCAAERTGKCKPAECSLPSGTGAKSCQLAWLFDTAKENEAANG